MSTKTYVAGTQKTRQASNHNSNNYESEQIQLYTLNCVYLDSDLGIIYFSEHVKLVELETLQASIGICGQYAYLEERIKSS